MSLRRKILQKILCFDEKATKRSSSSSTFICQICMEDHPNSNLFINKSRCSQNHPFCSDCIAQYITSKVKDNSKIKCPGVNCKVFLHPLLCRPILSPSVFVRWCDSICNDLVLDLPAWAYCPNPHCSALIVDECRGGIVRKVECPSCKKPFCFRNKVLWHGDNEFCCDGEKKRKEDVVIGKLVKRWGWQICPKCEHCIERSYGCTAMKCRCGHFFCYSCGAKLGLFHMFHNC